MDELYNCPVSGCNYGPSVKNSVAAHYSGKKPETGHEGGYERALALIEQADPAEQAAGEAAGEAAAEQAAGAAAAEQAKPPQQAAAEQAAAEQAKPAGGTPVADGPDPDPTPTVVDHTEGPTCPECGGSDLFDASVHTDGRFQYGCRACSDGSTWEVFNADE